MMSVSNVTGNSFVLVAWAYCFCPVAEQCHDALSLYSEQGQDELRIALYIDILHLFSHLTVVG